MPTSVTCWYNDNEISIEEAIRIRKNEKSTLFLCVNCSEQVKAHSGGGHTTAHFEHIHRNPECPLSHSDSYKYGGSQTGNRQNPDSTEAIEGYAAERKLLCRHRNAAVVLLCKKRDNYTCRSCRMSLRVKGKSIIECHHILPLANIGQRITSVDDLISLCPTCHRVAHTSNPPIELEKIIAIMKDSEKKTKST